MERTITSRKYNATGEYFWEMTQKRYGEIVLAQGIFAKGMIPHKDYVYQALFEGKIVPIKVLKDYPEGLF